MNDLILYLMSSCVAGDGVNVYLWMLFEKPVKIQINEAQFIGYFIQNIH